MTEFLVSGLYFSEGLRELFQQLRPKPPTNICLKPKTTAHLQGQKLKASSHQNTVEQSPRENK